MATGLRGKRFLNTFAWIAAILALSLAPIPYSASRNAPLIAVATANPQKDLAQELGQRITRVPEFQFIREEAKRMGVKAYLFGGTAAGFAHYVNWDLKRESGDKRFQPDRFDYDYTNIYRSTQDLDIVIDGLPEKAQELQAKLAQNFPHLQGNKTVWEVRLLRQDMGDKQALLNNPEFLNQHTDSNSTGMIEITPPENGEPVVRDLRDWESKDPYFLRDVREGKLHYYFSPKHAQTQFAKEGRNPPILSVIRYLTKAFQYELEIRPEDLAQIKKIIDEFDPKGRELENDYVRNWLLKKDNGRKLIQNAVNIEYAWDTLEKLGLRKKLIAIENNANTENSLAWWMSKEPLRSHAVGSGPRVSQSTKGRTIRELIAKGELPQDLTVAHETNNFLAYESITRAHTGDPNVLISRNNKVGEAAAFGNGFYTQIGRKGARGTGITIRFQVHPDAKEGVDFTRKDSYLIFHNKNALQVIPESLQLTPRQYFEFLANGEKVDPSERALFEKLKRKVTAGQGIISDEDYRSIQEVVATSIQKGEFNETLLKEWAALPKSADWSHDLFDPVLKLKVYDIPLSEMILTRPQFAKVPKFAEINATTQRLRDSLPKFHGPYGPVLSEAIQNHPDDAMRLAYPLSSTLEEESLSLLFKDLLPKVESESFILKAIEDISLRTAWDGKSRATQMNHLITHLFTQPRTKNWKSAKSALIDRLVSSNQLDELYEKVLSNPELSDEDTSIVAIKRLKSITKHQSGTLSGPHFQKLADQVLKKPFAKYWNHARMQFIKHSPPTLASELLEEITRRPDHIELISNLVREGSVEVDEGLARAFDLASDLKKDPTWLKEYLKRPAYDDALFKSALEHPAIAGDSASVIRLISNGPNPLILPSDSAKAIVRTTLQNPELSRNPEVIEAVTQRYIHSIDIARNLFARKDLSQHPEWVEPFVQLGYGAADAELAKLLKDPTWKDHPDWLQTLVKRNKVGQKELQKLIAEPHWKNHPALREMCGGKVPDFYCLSNGKPNPPFVKCVIGAIQWLLGR